MCMFSLPWLLHWKCRRLCIHDCTSLAVITLGPLESAGLNVIRIPVRRCPGGGSKRACAWAHSFAEGHCIRLASACRTSCRRSALSAGWNRRIRNRRTPMVRLRCALLSLAFGHHLAIEHRTTGGMFHTYRAAYRMGGKDPTIPSPWHSALESFWLLQKRAFHMEDYSTLIGAR